MGEKHNVNDYFKEEKERKLKEYLEQQEELSKKQAEKIRRRNLIKRGLYRLEKSKSYQPGYVYNHEENCFVKEVAYELTDEEYELVRKYTPIDEMEEKSSGIYFLTIIAGWFMLIFGTTISLLLAGSGRDGSAAIISFMFTFISCITFFALARIIYLLENKKNK